MELRDSILLLLYATSIAASLSLDHLPHREDFSELQPFKDDEDDEQYDFVQRTMSHKRKTNSEFPSSVFSKGRSDPDSYFGSIYPPMQSFKSHMKREARSSKDDKNNQKELTDILKDDEAEKDDTVKDKKVPPDTKRNEPASKKKKRNSHENELVEDPEIHNEKPEQEDSNFSDWLRREYYRNMAKSFASMRRKRAMWEPSLKEKPVERRSVAPPARASAPRQKKKVRFEDVTDNLKAIEDALVADALQVIEEGNDDYDDREKVRHRVTNDLNAAYDIETMRSALFRLQNTLYDMEEEKNVDSRQFAVTYKKHKRGDQCPPLNVLTSDCAALSDIVPDDALKELLAHACNWHEVCYSCGEEFGLSSDSCDMGFVEQSQTICRGDVPCESTAKLLLIPLRQRRVFYKRSNPSACMVDPCVEEFLGSG